MYKLPNGEEIFIIDAHIALWDGSKENQLNIHGDQFISCFYDYHTNLSPDEYIWPKEKFLKYDPETLVKDVFIKGYSDIAIFQPVYLKEFYKNGFGDFDANEELAKKYKNRFICNGTFDPRHGERGLEQLEENKEKYNWQGVKLYTADWYGDSKGYKLSDPWAKRYLEKCLELGIKNIHVHKGPTITPLNRDAFDVADIDDAASTFPDLNFIVEHVGLPRLEDFCWIATQEKNVYGGLAVAMPFIHSRPRYFAEIISELLYWIGEDRILFGSDYAIWEPGWLIEKFIEMELPDDIQKETGANLDLNVKKKILGENVAALYNIDIEAHKKLLKDCSLANHFA
ncbi:MULTISPECIES: amidohydrolase family protein [Metabacillus]|uniref:amidohydrolase family protein n=1 Tax=Metabacillus TaxID=2675233 RepID=UPI000EF61AA8|nr:MULTISPECIES: amidohydrolase family protein [Metabacillus]UGB32973.1 amidohydrolase family protein [Metabacillus sp. B2-18]UHA59017.1 amidohydrolase family protein [Metabacillus litoralis]